MMATDRPYKSLVVGLGQIGQQLDYSLNNAVYQQTHSSAYHQHPQYLLCGGVDIDPDKRQHFENKYNVPAFDSIDDAMISTQSEVVSIATPTDSHFSLFTSLTRHRVKAVVMEKPLASVANDATKIVTLARHHKIRLIVNYVRRYEPGSNELRRRLREGLIGEIQKGVVYYCKGIRNNGSHFIDLLSYLFGPPSGIKKLTDGRSISIGRSIDHEPDLLIDFNGIPVYFLALNYEYFSEVSLRLSGSLGIVHYDADGICYNGLITQGTGTVASTLSRINHTINTDFARYQFHVLTALADALATCDDPTHYDGQGARDILTLLESVDV